MRPVASVFLLLFAVIASRATAAMATDTGVKISYQLPNTGPLPRTYRVTLAITSADDPHWVISTFLAGAARTVTDDNKGEFTEYWYGLDDNFMPVPAGHYSVKGIFMPAQKWQVTGEFHSLIPKLAVAAGDSWFPRPDQDGRVPWTRAAGFGTMTAVAIGKNGQAVFLHNYLENASNPFLIDLTKPIGPDQVVQGFPSGGTAGGAAVATDGQIVWAVSPSGRNGDIIYRADGQPFGDDNGIYRSKVFATAGPVTSLVAWQDPVTKRSYLYAAEGGAASDLAILDGETGEFLERTRIRGIRALAIAGDTLFALYRADDGHWLIERTVLHAGIPANTWQAWLNLREVDDATDFKVDAHGRTFVSDQSANQVVAFDKDGRLLRHFGDGTQQRPGHYDDQSFMAPGGVALWTDSKGQERLIVVERAGGGRVSEWNIDGQLLRQWFPGIVTGNNGYAVDPEDTNEIYALSPSGRGVVRFHVNYRSGEWRLEAVWPDIAAADGCPGGSGSPKIIETNGHKYLAFALSRGNEQPCGYTIYRLEAGQWVPSAGLLRSPADPKNPQASRFAWWNGTDGYRTAQQTADRQPSAVLPTVMNYWGTEWLDDLSLVMLDPGAQHVWRIAPSRFNAQGDPVFEDSQWRELLADPVVQSLKTEHSDPRHGGNELLPVTGNTWMDITRTPDRGFIVAASTGPGWAEGIDSTGRVASQVKISRYIRDIEGRYRLLWRVGRKAFSLANPGEIYGALRVSGPINGLIAVEDGNGLVHVFTDDGLYVDTLFYDVYRSDPARGGVYALGGELFNGYAFLNKRDDNVYLAMGRDAATVYRVQGWAGSGHIVSPITSLPSEIALTAKDIAPVPSDALRLRQGSPLQHVIAIAPATGGSPALDGSLGGWDSAEPIKFGIDTDRAADVRAMYDPNTLYFRLHLRLPGPVHPAEPGKLDRIFTDAAGADTLSLYIQGDTAVSGNGADGRPGDVRFVCALVKEANGLKPVIVGMYPSIDEQGPHQAVTYTSPVSSVSFAKVAPVEGAHIGYALDPDGHGFTIAVALPRSAIPGLPDLGADALRHTTIDFDATLGGKTKFWWANTDGSASTVTSDVPSEAGLYPGAWGDAQLVPLGDALPVRDWRISGPWGGAGLASIAPPSDRDVNRWKTDIMRFFRSAHYPADDQLAGSIGEYSGPLSADAKGKTHLIAWHTERSRDNDDIVQLGDPGALYFASEWIWSPDERQVRAEFLHRPQNEVDAWLNGIKLDGAPYMPLPDDLDAPASPQNLALHPGWNLLRLRSFAVGYDLGIGVRLVDSPARLWQLRLSPVPPS